MAGLGVADVDAVEQDDDLLLCAASYRDVGLCTNGASLADIHADGVFQQIVNTLYGSLLNVSTVQYSDHSRSLTLGQGRPGAGDAHFVEHQLLCRLRADGVGRDGLCADGACRRVCERRDTKHRADHLAA